ncbi:MAG: AI-2E family transporter [Anaerolineaceae bacterium]
MNQTDSENLPRWGNTTKLIVTFSLVVIIGLLLWKFQFVLGPLLFAVVLAYLLHPVAGFLHKKIHIPWRLAATLLYLVIFIILFGLIAWGGISLIQPLQSLIAFLQNVIGDLPTTIAHLSSQAWTLGPFTINLTHLNLTQLWTELQGIISPILASIGTLLGNIASGAVSTIIWTIFTVLVSYFFSLESSGIRSNLIQLNVPRYQADFDLMKKYLSGIWGAFLRGQLTIFVITYIVYSILLAGFGVKYFFALAILAGLARFVPYVGPFIAWTTYGLVAIFQGTTILGLQPFPYALIIVGSAILIDVIMDNLVSPRVMANALAVHPAAVLVTVIVAAKLIGFVGVLLAAPVVASLKLFLHYTTHKLMDLDPWEGLETIPPPPPLRITLANLMNKFRSLRNRKVKSTKNNSDERGQNTQSESPKKE